MFWELDSDHDMKIDFNTFYNHDNCGISTAVLERVMACYGVNNQLSYIDFAYFLLASESKQSKCAIEYWFRVLDCDGDGFLSLYELGMFWDEQRARIGSIDDVWTQEDFICCL